ncbi:hypothetical protein GCM10009736_35770 [Actinomadura bangladeshensis]
MATAGIPMAAAVSTSGSSAVIRTSCPAFRAAVARGAMPKTTAALPPAVNKNLMAIRLLPLDGGGDDRAECST